MIKQQTAGLLSNKSDDRPTCDKLIELKKTWLIPFQDIKQEIVANVNVGKNYDKNIEFIQYFLKTKLSVNKL